MTVRFIPKEQESNFIEAGDLLLEKSGSLYAVVQVGVGTHKVCNLSSFNRRTDKTFGRHTSLGLISKLNDLEFVRVIKQGTFNIIVEEK